MLPELKNALLARINRIPIVRTLELEMVGFGDGTCETRVPRRRKYDGVFESFHGGLLMTIADSTACFAILLNRQLNMFTMLHKQFWDA